MNNAGEALIGLVIGAILVVVFLLFGPGTPGSRMICPEPVYAAGTDQLLSCHGKDSVVLVTPTPEVRR